MKNIKNNLIWAVYGGVAGALVPTILFVLILLTDNTALIQSYSSISLIYKWTETFWDKLVVLGVVNKHDATTCFILMLLSYICIGACVGIILRFMFNLIQGFRKFR